MADETGEFPADAGQSGDADVVFEWVQEAVAGDREAMQRLLLQQHEGLCRYVAGLMEPRLRARLEPEDVLQDAYAEACRHVNGCCFDGPNGFYEWLRTIVRNKLTDHQRALWTEKRDPRREVREDRRASYADLFDRIQASGRTPSRVAAGREGAAAILTCLAQLKAEYRQVIQLRFLEGRPVSEVMAIMGKSEGSVHMLCHRALKEMRTLMLSASKFLSQQ